MLSEQYMNPKRTRPTYPAKRAFVPVSNLALAAAKFAHPPANHPNDEKPSKDDEEHWGMLRIYCKETTLHGWKYFVKPRRPKWERIYWLVVILILYSLLSKLMWEQLIDFSRRPVLISFEPEPTSISSLPFPAVTLCPDMQVRKSYFNISQFTDPSLNLTDEESRHLYLSLFICSLTMDDVMPPVFDFTPELLYNFGKAHASYSQCRDFVVSAKYGLGELEDPCWYFQTTYSEFGICFSFNFLPADQLLRPTIDTDTCVEVNISIGSKNKVCVCPWDGEGNGLTCYTGLNRLRISLYRRYSGHIKSRGFAKEVVWTVDGGYLPGKKEFQPTKKGNSPIAASDESVSLGLEFSLQVPTHLFDPLCLGGRGFHGYIHNPAHIPTTGQQYFYLASSEEIDVEVSPEVSTISSELLSWTPQSRQCYMHNERKLAFFSFYTQRNCQIECESNFTLEVCDCIIHYRPRHHNIPVCGPKFWFCLAENSELTDTLDCKCLPSCSDISYLASFTKLKKRSAEKANASSDGLLTMDLKVSFYSKFVQGIRRSSPKQFTDMVADVGGLLGLFTGFGILSLIEIVYFLFLKQRKKPNPSDLSVTRDIWANYHP